jgi:hypothetical protein
MTINLNSHHETDPKQLEHTLKMKHGLSPNKKKVLVYWINYVPISLVVIIVAIFVIGDGVLETEVE